MILLLLLIMLLYWYWNYWNCYCYCIIINMDIVIIIVDHYYYCSNIVTVNPVNWISRYLLLLLYIVTKRPSIYYYCRIPVDDVEGPWRCFQGQQIWFCIALFWIVMNCAIIVLFLVYCIKVSCYIALVEASYVTEVISLP